MKNAIFIILILSCLAIRLKKDDNTTTPPTQDNATPTAATPIPSNPATTQDNSTATPATTTQDNATPTATPATTTQDNATPTVQTNDQVKADSKDQNNSLAQSNSQQPVQEQTNPEPKDASQENKRVSEPLDRETCKQKNCKKKEEPKKKCKKKEEEPKQEESKQEEPKKEEPKKEEPKKKCKKKEEEPKQEEPKKKCKKKEEPKQEEPKQEQPKQEQPKQEEPKQEQPKQEEPKKEEPKQSENTFPQLKPITPSEIPSKTDYAVKSSEKGTNINVQLFDQNNNTNPKSEQSRTADSPLMKALEAFGNKLDTFSSQKREPQSIILNNKVTIPSQKAEEDSSKSSESNFKDILARKNKEIEELTQIIKKNKDSSKPSSESAEHQVDPTLNALFQDLNPTLQLTSPTPRRFIIPTGSTLRPVSSSLPFSPPRVPQPYYSSTAFLK